MLIVNGKVLNLSQPSTDIEKQVKSDIDKIIEEYGLDKGGTATFAYPSRYIRPNKMNPGKPDKPASFLIQYRDIVGDSTGSSEWRWCRGMTPVKDGVISYFPKSQIFTGMWSLTLKEVDLIYFLIKCYSRLEGGVNSSPNVKPYIAIFDPVRDAKVKTDKALRESMATVAILASPDHGGLSDENIVKLAERLNLVGARTRDTAILRQELNDVVKKQIGAIDVITKFIDEVSQSKESSDPEADAIVEFAKELIAYKVIVIEKKGPISMFIPVINGEPQEKIANCSYASKAPAESVQLAKCLKEDDALSAILLAQLEKAKVVPEGKDPQ